MTGQRDLDARLQRFLLEEAPQRVPERLIAATREEVAGTSQRRLGVQFGGRLSNVVLTPVGAVAAALAVLVVGSALLLSNGPGPGPGSAPSPVASAPSSTGPSPSPSRLPSPSACPREKQPCVPELEPGTHSTAAFLPTVTYTVPAGWMSTEDNRGQFDLRYAAGEQYTYPDGLTFHDGISIFRRPVAQSATSDGPLKGIGTTANDLSRWLAGHSDLVASAAAPITIGGAPGYRLTLRLPNAPRASPDHCTEHGEPRCTSLFISSDPAATYGFGLVGPEVAVVYLLDVAPGETVMVVIDDTDGVDQAGLEAAARPVVESLSFSP